jgi:hypothetical protein
VSSGELAQTSRIAAAAARQQRDAAKAGASGSTAPVAPTVIPPMPPKAAVQSTVDNMFGDISWAKGIAMSMMDFVGFVGAGWPWIAAAVALYFAARMMWDSHLIKSWRVEDAIGGYTS